MTLEQSFERLTLYITDLETEVRRLRSAVVAASEVAEKALERLQRAEVVCSAARHFKHDPYLLRDALKTYDESKAS